MRVFEVIALLVGPADIHAVKAAFFTGVFPDRGFDLAVTDCVDGFLVLSGHGRFSFVLVDRCHSEKHGITGKMRQGKLRKVHRKVKAVIFIDESPAVLA